MHAHHALIIGIEKYGVYDRSAGLPAGTSTVAGAKNDARRYVRQCLDMGIAPERIRVLTAPGPLVLGPDAAGVTTGVASRDEIIQSLQWLVTAVVEAGPAAAGLLAFSGHGDCSRGIVMCPADVTASLDQVVVVDEVRDALGPRGTSCALTVLFDGHRAPAGLDGTSIRARLLDRMHGVERSAAATDDRLIAACKGDQRSTAGDFDGELMGAFAWAMTTAMSEHGKELLATSHAALLRRARELLGARSVEEMPVLQGKPGVAARPLLAPSAAPGASKRPMLSGPMSTSNGQSVTMPDLQLDPGEYSYRLYQMQSVDSTGATKLLARVLVAGDAQIEVTDVTTSETLMLEPATEYWYIDNAVLEELIESPGARLTMQIVADGSSGSAAITWPGATLEEQVVQRDVSWLGPNSPSPEGPLFALSSDTAAEVRAMPGCPSGLRLVVTSTIQDEKTYYRLASTEWHQDAENSVSLLFGDGWNNSHLVVFQRSSDAMEGTKHAVAVHLQ